MFAGNLQRSDSHFKVHFVKQSFSISKNTFSISRHHQVTLYNSMKFAQLFNGEKLASSLLAKVLYLSEESFDCQSRSDSFLPILQNWV